MQTAASPRLPVSTFAPVLRPRLLLAVLWLIHAFLLLPTAHLNAASATFTGAPGTVNWTDPVWNPTPPGTPPGSAGGTTNGDTAFFNTNSGPTLLTIDAGRNVKSLTFQAGAGQFTIGSAGPNSGEKLHLSSGGLVSLETGVLGTITINAPLVLEPTSATGTGTYTFTNNTTNTTPTPGSTTATTPKLNVAGNISGGATSGNVTLTLAGIVGTRGATNSATALQQANTISGIISNGDAAALGITVSGTTSSSSAYNAWNLTGLNTFSGPVTIGTGVLYFDKIASMGQASSLGTGANGTVTVGSGAFLIYTGAAAASNRTFSGTGTIFNNGTGVLTLDGTITTTSNLTFRGSNHFIVNGLVTGTGGLQKTNVADTLTLNNALNDFGGALTINGGTVSTSSIADGLQVSGIGKGTAIAFSQSQASDQIAILQFTGANGGSSNRSILINAGSANTFAAPATAVLENTRAGQTLALSGTVRTAGAAINSTSFARLELRGDGNGVLSGVIGGLTTAPTTVSNLGLTKTGTGKWEVSAANFYYGSTEITGGTLVVSGSITGTAFVNVASSGTLATGANSAITTGLTANTVAGYTASYATGNVTVNGTLAPGGSSAGADVGKLTLSLAGKLHFAANSTLLFGLGSTSDLITFGTAGDFLSGSGNATLQLDVTQAGFSYENDYTVFENVTTAGFGFASIRGYDTANYRANLVQSGTSYLVDFQAVPEPSQAALLVMGLLSLLSQRRRRA